MNGLPRQVEFALALCGLIAVSPLLLVAAILIKLTSPGAVVFRQRRIGLNGKEFVIFKFRTMRVDAIGAAVTASKDSRVTFVGRILRKTKIDELPELCNVLRGEMSFVGPRPEIPQMVDLENHLWRRVLSAKPGITDPVTLRLRNEETLLAEMGAHDHEAFYKEVLQPYKLKSGILYLDQRTVKSDIKVLILTVLAIVAPRTTALPSLAELQMPFAEQQI